MLKRLAVLTAAMLGLSITAAHATYSVVAYDPKTGHLGVAVQSNTPSVGARVRWGRAGVAAIASQAGSNPMMGEIGVTLIQRGFSPEEARDMLVKMDNGAANRQFAIVDTKGRTAGWTGDATSGFAGHICQPNFCVEANTMTGPEVQNSMAIAYVKTTAQKLPLVERLIAVLEAAEAAGGDRRGKQSAGVMIFAQRAVAGYGDHMYDIRVDDNADPLKELRRIYNVTEARNLPNHIGNHIAAGKFDEALAEVNKRLALDPTSDDALADRARVYLAMNKTADAIKTLRQAIGINPKLYYQVLRNEDFKPLWDNAGYRALGDYSRFHPLAASMTGSDSMPMPPIP
ncbi:MAG: DUF1028 domain-containing protein [Rhodospirillaceae bacterium]